MKNFILILLISFFSHSQTRSHLSGPFPDDDFMAMLNPLGPTYNIYHLDRLHLTKGKSIHEPWAGSYWPIHRGILAYRYPDKENYKSKTFINNYDAFNAKPASAYINEGQLNRLSPAEKYDLLVGDSNWTLTRAMRKKGYDDLTTKGVVAGWTGICHGWSAISQLDIAPPSSAVVVPDVTGNYSIRFNESDIRGLVSYLWAESPPETKQAGHRCYQVPITRDSFLRPVDAACLDTNPMTWHLSITNRLGRYGKSFVMDSSAGAEVWNYPIASYDYTYFNPRTYLPVQSLRQAIVPIEELTSDRFTGLRNEKTRFVVGIIMDVFHPALIEPTTGKSGSSFQSHTFVYDLELDENYDVIGGEWISDQQPDFIWTFPDNGRAQTREDLYDNPPWDAASPISPVIAERAIQASQRGKVMATIVEALHKRSREPNVTPATPEDTVEHPPEVVPTPTADSAND